MFVSENRNDSLINLPVFQPKINTKIIDKKRITETAVSAINKHLGEFNSLVSFADESSKAPSFWKFHPIGRGIGIGLMHSLFYKSFITGFIYGSISGIVNLGTRPGFKKLTIGSPETKAAVYYLAASTQWVTSAVIMNELFKLSGNSNFLISKRAAITLAIANEFFCYANETYLAIENKPKSDLSVNQGKMLEIKRCAFRAALLF